LYLWTWRRCAERRLGIYAEVVLTAYNSKKNAMIG
jgi:hypothetical protein